MEQLTLVVPCYNEESALPLFFDAACKACVALPEIETTFLFIDDGSCDRTLDTLRALAKRDKRVRYRSFSRNFGKEAAMLAGLQAAEGDYVAVLDADMQDPPALLGEMLQILRTGTHDCVATRRVNRAGEPPIRSFFARVFYKMINRISKTEIVDGARDFRMMTRRMVNAILQLPEYNRFSKGIFSWVGFRTHWLEYVNVKRVAGETKWSFWKLFLYSLDGIAAFSTVPLSLSAFIGFAFCALSFCFLVFIVVRAAIWGDPVAGWPSMVCIILLTSGVQLFCLGIVGQYLSKTYLEVKRRPQYIIQETECDRREPS